MDNSTANDGIPYVPLNKQVSPDTMKRARALKGLCICELLFSIWGALFISNFYIILIPIDLIGLIAAGKLNPTMLNIFSLLKALCVGFVGVFIADFVYQYIDYHLDDALLMGVLLLAELFIQALCLMVAIRIRKDILLAQASTAVTVELSSVSDSSVPQQQAQMSMQVPPQHFQDPHATAGVPGYPYPPTSTQQFYPVMYMNQGYPTPYAHYPMMMNPNGMPVAAPVATYPTFTINEEQQSTDTRQ